MYISIILYIHEVKVPIHPGTHRMFGHLKDWTWPLWSEPLAYRKILTDPFMIQNDWAIVYIYKYIEGSRLAKELSKKKEWFDVQNPTTNYTWFYHLVCCINWKKLYSGLTTSLRMMPRNSQLANNCAQHDPEIVVNSQKLVTKMMPRYL